MGLANKPQLSPPAPALERPQGGAPASVEPDIDAQLMLLLQGGDKDASRRLIERNFERVTRYVGRLIRDPRTVEDLAQDVFLHILSHARQYSPTAKFSTWLYRVATNAALSYLNSARVRRATASGPADTTPCGRSERPESRLTVEELRARVARAVDNLPASQRAALTLFEYEHLAYDQIAAVLEVSEDAVRCLLTRARTTLRERLRDLVE